MLKLKAKFSQEQSWAAGHGRPVQAGYRQPNFVELQLGMALQTLPAAKRSFLQIADICDVSRPR